MNPTIATAGPSDRPVNMTRVDALAAAIGRRETIWTIGKSVLVGGIGFGALCFGASFLLQKARLEVVEVPTVYTDTKVVEVPTVYTDTKVIEVPRIVEVPKLVERTVEAPKAEPKIAEANPAGQPKAPEVCDGAYCQPVSPPTASGKDWLGRCEKFGNGAEYCTYLLAHYPPSVTGDGPARWLQPLPKPARPLAKAPVTKPAPTTETRPWNALTGKKFVGRITDIVNGAVCYDHDTIEAHCTHLIVTDATGHAVLDHDGQMVVSTTEDLAPMRIWIGYDAYRAERPEDPAHLSDFWVADQHGALIKFETSPKQPTADNESKAVPSSGPNWGPRT
jgi:hypothetical protein